MRKSETLGDGETKIINMTDYGNTPKLDERILQRFYDLSNHLDKSDETNDPSMNVAYSKEDEKKKAIKPSMRVVYSKTQEKARLDAFYALSDHLD